MKVECWDGGKCWLKGEVVVILSNLDNPPTVVVKDSKGWLRTSPVYGVKVIEEKE